MSVCTFFFIAEPRLNLFFSVPGLSGIESLSSMLLRSRELGQSPGEASCGEAGSEQRGWRSGGWEVGTPTCVKRLSPWGSLRPLCLSHLGPMGSLHAPLSNLIFWVRRGHPSQGSSQRNLLGRTRFSFEKKMLVVLYTSHPPASDW